ncbi:isopenicillin N synthase family oxygenase [Salinispirillum sp. LH 10-3-1]|uniref:2-oxoglutarate-dependent ethylene/succinate-forming enzyme n=1 Tax=Salinispirillum sp. LH 10-3-1 TaxID=2952525 RepID=A0AB38YF89_9GAMM
MTQIPTLDINRFHTDRHDFVQELGDAYAEWGFAGITGHGIAPELITEALAVSERFFALPEATKLRYKSSYGGARGYTPLGVEVAKGAAHVDLKEFWHVGREVDGTPRFPQLLPNAWPEELPEFKAVLLKLYDALDNLGRDVLRALALYLGQDENYFDDKVDSGNSILRPLHYPPVIDEGTRSVRAAAHEDINLITLLVGSRQSGLEVLSQRGEWVPISIIPGTIIVNIGDMLQRLTNHVLPSTTHRVVNPEGEAARQSRYSIPFFLHPNPDVSLDALPECVTPENPKRYPPITANEYLEERLREIGLLK